MKHKLFLDSDSVFASFETHAYDLYGIICERVSDDVLWDTIRNDYQRFWATMPKMPDADLLWDFVKDHHPIILTGCPKCHFEEASLMKRQWWKANFDYDNVVTCLARNKSNYVTLPTDILCDDTKRNIVRWVEAGGIGILHTSAENTIKELSKYIS